MTNRRAYGRRMELSTSMLRYPQMVEQAKDMLLSGLRVQAEGDGMDLSTETDLIWADPRSVTYEIEDEDEEFTLYYVEAIYEEKP